METDPRNLIVDSGDMLARLTNDVIPATTHRVVNPAGLDAVFNGQPAPLQPGFATMDETEVSPLGLDIVKYAVTP